MTRRSRLLLAMGALGAAGACRGGSATPATAQEQGSAAVLAAAPTDAAIELPPLVLGASDVTAYGYRKRAGHPAFRRARASEAAGDWTAVVAACREALAADPQHLDAAYLLAVALAKTDAPPRAVLEPLSIAVGGDFIKWGSAALVQPALQPVLSTPVGQAWRARVDTARAELLPVLAHATLVTANGDIYAIAGDRWYRVTRSGGAVLGSLRIRGRTELAYVTSHKKELGIGVVDLAALRSKKILYVTDPLRIAYEAGKRNAFLVYTAKKWSQLVETDTTLALRPIPPAEHPGYLPSLADGATLDVRSRRATLQRLTTPHVSADYDQRRLTSTLRIDTTRRVVTVPSPGLAFGDTITPSPDGAQIAFVAQLTDDCAPKDVAATAVYVADASTGTPRELERASGGMAVEWVGDRALAVAGDKGVSIYTLDGTPPKSIVGADGLVTPRRAACVAPAAPVPEDEPAEPDSE